MEKKETVKIIFHIDMNAFFCSVACLQNPSLRGKVFAIGRENSYRGVISSASYEARALGIKAAMSQKEAYDKVPNLIIVSVAYSVCKHYHLLFVKLLEEYTNVIEVASIDEAYIDVTEISKTRHPLVIAKEIQVRLLKEIGLPCSIGIAPTLFLAKMASDLKKPLGITVVRKRDVKEIIYPLSVSEIYGIGKKTYPSLIENGITVIGDFFIKENKEKIINLIGKKTFDYVISHVSGNSSNKVEPDRYADSKSISTSITFERVITTEVEALYELRKMTREIVSKMKRNAYYTKTINVTFRTVDFKTKTRSKTIDDYTDDFVEIFDVVAELVELNYHNEELRLLGIGVSNLIEASELPKEYNLFTIMDKNTKECVIEQMIETMQQKYGKNSLYRKKR